MKTLLLITLFSLPAVAEVSLQDCQDDALLYGNHKTSVQPLAECAGLVKSAPAAVSVTSSDRRYKAFGFGNMVYVETYDEGNVLTDRTLLAGDQTELVSVRNLFIDTQEKRLLIIQEKNHRTELMIHKLDFIGNVSPLKVMRSPVFGEATALRYVSENELELTTPAGNYSVGADGESREHLSSNKPLAITPK